MTSHRPFSSYSVDDLRRLAESAASPEVLDQISHELGYRTTKAARALAEQLAQKRVSPLGKQIAGEPAAGGTTGQPPKSPDMKRGNTGAQPAVRRRATVPRPSHKPTDEQAAAVQAFMTGGTLKISAFAGAGKTSTLQLMANERQGRGLYLAFNKKIAEEAREKFPRDVDCRTTHSVAARAVMARHGYSKQKMFDTMRAPQLAATLQLKKVRIAEAITLNETQQAFLFLSAVRQFCQSADTSIEVHHLRPSGRLVGLKPETREQVNRWVVQQARAIWSRMLDPSDEVPLGHDGYLKYWSLGAPTLDYDYILLDEAQDTNPVVLEVLTKQQSQLVYVGDKHQQIYEWRGAINAMAKIETEHETALTQSFRFGPAIAEAANAILKRLGETRPLQGLSSVQSRIAPSASTDAILARTNAMVISATLSAVDGGRLPHIVGGTDELERLVKDVFSLQRGEPGSHPDFFGFDNWDDVVAFSEAEEGVDLRRFVTLVQKNGPGRLWSAIRQSTSDELAADVSISTAHKAKGCEWNSVQIAEDFSGSGTGEGEIPESEARLFYVAITRAKNVLSVSPVLLAAFTTGNSFTSDQQAKKATASTKLRDSAIATPASSSPNVKPKPQPLKATPERPGRDASSGEATAAQPQQKPSLAPPERNAGTSSSPQSPPTSPTPTPKSDASTKKPEKKRGGFWSFLGFGKEK